MGYISELFTTISVNDKHSLLWNVLINTDGHSKVQAFSDHVHSGQSVHPYSWSGGLKARSTLWTVLRCLIIFDVDPEVSL